MIGADGPLRSGRIPSAGMVFEAGFDRLWFGVFPVIAVEPLQIAIKRLGHQKKSGAARI